MQPQLYTTDELELAAYLKARGHRLIDAAATGTLVTFSFAPSAQADLAEYFAGAEISARELFQAHRHLRALIEQIKQTSQRNGPTTYEPLYPK